MNTQVPLLSKSRSTNCRSAAETSGLVIVDITERAAVVSGLVEERPRYDVQHALGFQVHDVRHPHRVAYVLNGQRLGDHGMVEVLSAIPVLPTGMGDLGELRMRVGRRWARARSV